MHKVLSPFKGVCNCCQQRTIVRPYPYNESEWLGTYCKPCIEKIDEALGDGAGLLLHTLRGYCG